MMAASNAYAHTHARKGFTQQVSELWAEPTVCAPVQVELRPTADQVSISPNIYKY